SRETHRVRGAWIHGDRLVVDFVRGRSPSLGPLALCISCDGASGPLTRLTIALPTRSGSSPVLDGSRRAGLGPARPWREGDHWRIDGPLALAARPLRTYVKVERPVELACGFFDESGWWPVASEAERAPSPLTGGLSLA